MTKKITAKFIHDIATPLAHIQLLTKKLERYLDDSAIKLEPNQRHTLSEIHLLAQQIKNASNVHWETINTMKLDSVDDSISHSVKLPKRLSLEDSLAILVAEDDIVHQKIAQKLLSTKHKVQIVPNGKEAVDAVERNDYDLILMDFHMPLLDGKEAAQMISAFSLIPVIGLTNHPLNYQKTYLRSQGFSAFIEKPLNLERLGIVLENL